mgnify:CR=1 FL=1
MAKGTSIAELSGWQGFVARRGTRAESGAKEDDGKLDDAFALHLSNLFRAPTLDVDVVSHCNLNCASCCHFSPAAAPTFLSARAFDRNMEMLATIDGTAEFFEAVCLVGGEPLLHPELPSLVRIAHERLPGAQIRVVSNGILLAAMGPEFWEAMRTARADILLTPYPIGVDYSALVGLATSQGVDAVTGGGLSVVDGESFYFLRTPLDEEGLQDPAASFASCPLGGRTMQLVDGRIFPCNRGALLGIVNERFGTSFGHAKGDFLRLDSIIDIEEIDRFRREPHPMCRFCASSLSERIDWHPSDVDPSEWLMRPDERGKQRARH